MNIVAPETVGFSERRLARIRPAMQRYVDEKKLAGVMTLIARKGQIAHWESVGMADIEGGTPMQNDTLFRIYSMTKPITSVATLMLYEQGAFRLSDPVARYIPAFEGVKVLEDGPGAGGRTVAPTRPPNIHDLLTHTAGLSYGFERGALLDDLYQTHVWGARQTNPDLNLEQLISAVAKLPLAHQPGTRFRYSMATDVLGYLVQAVSGMPFEDFLRDNIFKPLGMADTGFQVPESEIGRFAATYGPDAEAGLKVTDAPRTSDFAKPQKVPSGGGGLVSTAGDYLRFAQMLLNSGELDGVRLLGRKTVELMTANCLPVGDTSFGGGTHGFGLGVSVLSDPARARTLGSVGNYGWGGAANTVFWVDPVEELIGILMLQFMPSETYPVIADFTILTYQALID